MFAFSVEAQAAAKKSVAFGAITGAKPKEVREWVRVVLDEEFELTDAEDFKPKNNDAAFAKMGKDLAVDFIVIGKLEQNRLLLTVRSGKDGKVVEEIALKGARGPQLKKAIANDLAPQLGEAVGQPVEEPAPKKAKAKGKAKPVDEDLAEEEAEEEEATEEEEASADEESEDTSEEEGAEESSGEAEEEEESEPLGPTAEPLIVTAAARFYRRTFTFNDTLQGVPLVRPLRNYQLPLGPSVFLRAQFYPAVFLKGDGFATNVGLIAGFEKGIATTSKYTGSDPGIPPSLTNDLQEWFIGLRMRFPSATNEFAFSGAYGQQRYFLEGDENLPTVPDVSYGYLKIGGDGRLIFGKFSLGAHLAARLLLSTGDLEEYWFENAAGVGLDMGLNAGYRVIDMISIVAGGDYLRYGLDFNPVSPDSVAVAGGAVDQFISGWIGVQFHLPGRGAVSASAEASSD